MPTDYSGELTVVLNDREPMVVLRNILLLVILGTTEDDVEAAELALHLWYSAFLRERQQARVSEALIKIMGPMIRNGNFSVKLGKQSNISGTMSMQTRTTLGMIFESNLEFGDIVNEINRVRYVPLLLVKVAPQSQWTFTQT